MCWNLLRTVNRSCAVNGNRAGRIFGMARNPPSFNPETPPPPTRSGFRPVTFMQPAT